MCLFQLLCSKHWDHITDNFLVLVHSQVGAFGSLGQRAQLQHLLTLFSLHCGLLAEIETGGHHFTAYNSKGQKLCEKEVSYVM